MTSYDFKSATLWKLLSVYYVGLGSDDRQDIEFRRPLGRLWSFVMSCFVMSLLNISLLFNLTGVIKIHGFLISANKFINYFEV